MKLSDTFHKITCMAENFLEMDQVHQLHESVIQYGEPGDVTSRGQTFTNDNALGNILDRLDSPSLSSWPNLVCNSPLDVAGFVPWYLHCRSALASAPGPWATVYAIYKLISL